MAWLTNLEKQRISTGRDWMDEYRADNLTRAAAGQNASEKLNKLIVFFQRMQEVPEYAGYSLREMLDFFFEMSRLMNVQEIGYETEEEFWANATETEKETYEGMWK